MVSYNINHDNAQEIAERMTQILGGDGVTTFAVVRASMQKGEREPMLRVTTSRQLQGQIQVESTGEGDNKITTISLSSLGVRHIFSSKGDSIEFP